MVGTGDKKVYYCLTHYQEKHSALDQYRPETIPTTNQALTPTMPAAPTQGDLGHYQHEEPPAP